MQGLGLYFQESSKDFNSAGTALTDLFVPGCREIQNLSNEASYYDKGRAWGHGVTDIALCVSCIKAVQIPGKTKQITTFNRISTNILRPPSSAMNGHLLKNRLIAEEISGGHAFSKHVINQKEFPGFSRLSFKQHIENILHKPSEMKALTIERTAYWDQRSGTLVIYDPLKNDGGTAFKPLNGKKYYDDVLK